MRVAHVVRSDDLTSSGGDVVHAVGWVEALRGLAVDADHGHIDTIDAPDIVHLYNLDRPHELLAGERHVRRRWPGAKVVVTPIFLPWDVPRIARSGEPWMMYGAARQGSMMRQVRVELRDLLGRCDAVVTNSHQERRAVSAHFEIPPGDRWHVVPVGIDASRWSVPRSPEARQALLDELGADPSATTIACVGRIEPLKNQRSLVRAVSRLEGVALALVGAVRQPRYGAQVLRSARRLPQQRTSLGQVGPTRLAEVLAGVDIHILPSFRDVVGLASLEAAAAGCKVVATHGPIEEYLSTGATYCEPSVKSIAAALGARRGGVQAQVVLPTWEDGARALVEVYEAVLS